MSVKCIELNLKEYMNISKWLTLCLYYHTLYHSQSRFQGHTRILSPSEFFDSSLISPVPKLFFPTPIKGARMKREFRDWTTRLFKTEIVPLKSKKSG